MSTLLGPRLEVVSTIVYDEVCGYSSTGRIASIEVLDRPVRGNLLGTEWMLRY
jgi:hypothetical protein